MKYLLLFLPFLLTGHSAFGQGSAYHPVTLAESIDLALANSAQLRKAKLDRQGFEHRLNEGRAGVYPQIGAKVDFDAYPVLPTQLLPGDAIGRTDGSYIPVQFGRPWQLGSTIQVEQAIYSEAARRSVPATNVSRSLYDLLTEKAEEEVVFQTASVFFQLLQAETTLRVIDANLHKINELQRITALQAENDYAIPTDVKRLRVARNNLDNQRMNLQTGIETLRQTLQFLCGLPFDQPLDPVYEDLDAPGADSLRWLSMRLESETLTEHRLLLHNLELNRIRANSLKAEGLPSLGAHATLGFLSWRDDANFLASGNRWYGLAAVGFRLRIPIFDGFRRRNQIALLSIENLKLEEDRRQLLAAKSLEFRQAQEQLQNALFALRTTAENVQLAREISDNLSLPYREGTLPLPEVLNAQTALAEAETQYNQQVFAYRLAVLKLLKAGGKLSELKK